VAELFLAFLPLQAKNKNFSHFLIISSHSFRRIKGAVAGLPAITRRRRGGGTFLPDFERKSKNPLIYSHLRFPACIRYIFSFLPDQRKKNWHFSIILNLRPSFAVSSSTTAPTSRRTQSLSRHSVIR
jgi:hypothetical protein